MKLLELWSCLFPSVHFPLNRHNLRKAGVPKTVRMKLMGHKTDIMNRRYDTLDMADAIDAIQRYEQFLGQKNIPFISPREIEAKK
jgi:hypothetical protein